MPANEDIERFLDLEAKELSQLGDDFGLLSEKMVLGITGKDGEIMQSFIERLKSFSKSDSIKK